MNTETETHTDPASEPSSDDPTSISWSEAWSASPGPRSTKEALTLAAKGFCMGTADVIPGVSGGTIAFVTGIYEQLLAAIASIDLAMAKRILSADVKGALAEVHGRFLLALLAGIGCAILGTTRLMHYLLDHHPVETWSLFFGLIAASILVVGRKIEKWRESTLVLVLGTISAWQIVGLIPGDTPETKPYVFLCGMIAICAMILPGISGSFLLLILGKYRYVTGAVKEFWQIDNLMVLLTFGAGAVVGIVLFSRVLRFCLKRYHDPTMALLTGFMIGAMRKVWPWQRELESIMVRGKKKVLVTENFLPDAFTTEVALALLLMAAGVALVLLLERWAVAKEPDLSSDICSGGGVSQPSAKEDCNVQ